MQRRNFLGLLPAGAALAFVNQRVAHIPAADERRPSPVHTLYPTHDPAWVKEIVGAAHARIDRVKELVEARPELAKAAWDWGFGDWESALGAASHMGRSDIAELLIGHGARPNLYTHAMLGDLDVVKAAIEAQPGIQAIPGPHGISLLSHAKAGGDAAAGVASYLSERDDADPRATSLPTKEETLKLYVGKYMFGDAENDLLEIALNRNGLLTIKRGDASFGRTLLRVEEHGFAPSGAPSVRVRFRFQRGSVLSLSIHDPDPTIGARRLD